MGRAYAATIMTTATVVHRGNRSHKLRYSGVSSSDWQTRSAEVRFRKTPAWARLRDACRATFALFFFDLDALHRVSLRDGIYDILALENSPKYGVFAIEPGSCNVGDEEL